MKILIAVPCMDTNPVGFTHSLAVVNKPQGCVLSMLSGSLVYESRNNLCKQALNIGADYIMWFDSDMIFPQDTIEKMVKHMENGLEIVSGLYFRRAKPYTPVIFKSYTEMEDRIQWEDYNDYPNELFEIAGCGFGCVMVKTEILLDLALSYRNWFMPYKNSGEDMSFCFRARELGHKIYCDPTIKCGHTAYTTIDESIFKALGEPKVTIG